MCNDWTRTTTFCGTEAHTPHRDVCRSTVVDAVVVLQQEVDHGRVSMPPGFLGLKSIVDERNLIDMLEWRWKHHWFSKGDPNPAFMESGRVERFLLGASRFHEVVGEFAVRTRVRLSTRSLLFSQAPLRLESDSLYTKPRSLLFDWKLWTSPMSKEAHMRWLREGGPKDPSVMEGCASV